MKRLFVAALLLATLSGCAWANGSAPSAPSPWTVNGTNIVARSGTAGVIILTGADSITIGVVNTIDPTLSLNGARVLDASIYTGDTLHIGNDYITDFAGSAAEGLQVSGTGQLSVILGNSIDYTEIENYTIKKVNVDSTISLTLASLYLGDGADSTKAVQTKRYIDSTAFGLSFAAWSTGRAHGKIPKLDSTGGYHVTWSDDAGGASGDNLKFDSAGTVFDPTGNPIIKAGSNITLRRGATVDTIYVDGAAGGAIDTTHFLNIAAGDTVASGRTFNWGGARFDSLGVVDVDTLLVDSGIRFTGDFGSIANIRTVTGNPSYGLSLSTSAASVLTLGWAIGYVSLAQSGTQKWRIDGDSIAYGSAETSGGIVKNLKWLETDSADIGGVRIKGSSDIVSEAELPLLQLFRYVSTRDSWRADGATTNDSFMYITNSPTDATIRSATTKRLVIEGGAGNMEFADTSSFVNFPVDSVGKIDVNSIVVDSQIKLATYNYASGTQYGLILRADTGMTADLTLYGPRADGSAGQLLGTNGSGRLGWYSAGGGSSSSDSGTYWKAEGPTANQWLLRTNTSATDTILVFKDSSIYTVFGLGDASNSGIIFSAPVYFHSGSTVTAILNGTDSSIASEGEISDSLTALRARSPWSYTGGGTVRDTALLGLTSGPEAQVIHRPGTAGVDSVFFAPYATGDIPVFGLNKGVVLLDTAAIAQKFWKGVAISDSELVTYGRMIAASSGTRDSVNIYSGTTWYRATARSLNIIEGNSIDIVLKGSSPTGDTVKFDVKIDNSTIDTTSGGNLRVKDLGITTGKIAANAVDSTKIVTNSIYTDDVVNGTLLAADMNATWGSTVSFNCSQSELRNLDSLYADTGVFKNVFADTLVATNIRGTNLIKSGTIEATSTLWGEDIYSAAYHSAGAYGVSKTMVLGFSMFDETVFVETGVPFFQGLPVADSALWNIGRIKNNLDSTWVGTGKLAQNDVTWPVSYKSASKWVSWYYPSNGGATNDADTSAKLTFPFKVSETVDTLYLFRDSTITGNDTTFGPVLTFSCDEGFDSDSLVFLMCTSSATADSSKLDSIVITYTTEGSATINTIAATSAHGTDRAVTTLTRYAYVLDQDFAAGTEVRVRLNVALKQNNSFLKMMDAKLKGRRK